MRLRDYVVLCLLLMICFHMAPCLLSHFWACCRNAEILNFVRERQMEAEIKHGLF